MKWRYHTVQQHVYTHHATYAGFNHYHAIRTDTDYKQRERERERESERENDSYNSIHRFVSKQHHFAAGIRQSRNNRRTHTAGWLQPRVTAWKMRRRIRTLVRRWCIYHTDTETLILRIQQDTQSVYVQCDRWRDEQTNRERDIIIQSQIWTDRTARRRNMETQQKTPRTRAPAQSSVYTCRYIYTHTHTRTHTLNITAVNANGLLTKLERVNRLNINNYNNTYTLAAIKSSSNTAMAVGQWSDTFDRRYKAN